MNLEYEQARELRNALSRQGWGGRDATREIVRIRDNRTCQLCGKPWQFGERRFDVHHLNGLCGKKSKQYDKLENMDGLVTLCHKCHLSMDSVREKMGGSRKSDSEQIERYQKIRKIKWFEAGYRTNKAVAEIIGLSKTSVKQILRKGEAMGWDGFGREVELTSLENQLQ